MMGMHDIMQMMYMMAMRHIYMMQYTSQLYHTELPELEQGQATQYDKTLTLYASQPELAEAPAIRNEKL